MKSGLRNEEKKKKKQGGDKRVHTLNSDRFGSEVLLLYSIIPKYDPGELELISLYLSFPTVKWDMSIS